MCDLIIDICLLIMAVLGIAIFVLLELDYDKLALVLVEFFVILFAAYIMYVFFAFISINIINRLGVL